jgi:hypothetical protein
MSISGGFDSGDGVRTVHLDEFLTCFFENVRKKFVPSRTSQFIDLFIRLNDTYTLQNEALVQMGVPSMLKKLKAVHVSAPRVFRTYRFADLGSFAERILSLMSTSVRDLADFTKSYRGELDDHVFQILVELEHPEKLFVGEFSEEAKVAALRAHIELFEQLIACIVIVFRKVASMPESDTTYSLDDEFLESPTGSVDGGDDVQVRFGQDGRSSRMVHPSADDELFAGGISDDHRLSARLLKVEEFMEQSQRQFAVVRDSHQQLSSMVEASKTELTAGIASLADSLAHSMAVLTANVTASLRVREPVPDNARRDSVLRSAASPPASGSNSRLSSSRDRLAVFGSALGSDEAMDVRRVQMARDRARRPSEPSAFLVHPRGSSPVSLSLTDQFVGLTVGGPQGNSSVCVDDLSLQYNNTPVSVENLGSEGAGISELRFSSRASLTFGSYLQLLAHESEPFYLPSVVFQPAQHCPQDESAAGQRTKGNLTILRGVYCSSASGQRTLMTRVVSSLKRPVADGVSKYLSTLQQLPNGIPELFEFFEKARQGFLLLDKTVVMDVDVTRENIKNLASFQALVIGTMNRIARQRNTMIANSFTEYVMLFYVFYKVFIGAFSDQEDSIFQHLDTSRWLKIYQEAEDSLFHSQKVESQLVLAPAILKVFGWKCSVCLNVKAPSAWYCKKKECVDARVALVATVAPQS